MLEQMCEAGLAGLHFVARANMDDDVKRDNVWIACGDRHEPQTILKVVDRVGIRKDLVFRCAGCFGGVAAARQQEKDYGYKDSLHIFSRGPDCTVAFSLLTRTRSFGAEAKKPKSEWIYVAIYAAGIFSSCPT